MEGIGGRGVGGRGSAAVGGRRRRDLGGRRVEGWGKGWRIQTVGAGGGWMNGEMGSFWSGVKNKCGFKDWVRFAYAGSTNNG